VVDPAQTKIACRFSGRSVGTRPLGRYKRRGDNIKMDIQEVKWGCKNWIDLTQDIDR
jgi:hypothetical protein